MKKLNTDFGLALLRIAPSALMLFHGVPKLQNLINGNFDFPDPIGIGATPSLFLTVIAEFVCPILIIIGFKTKWATIPLLITMLVAIIIVHGADPIAVKEKALLYFFWFAAVFLLGPGKYSIDRR